MTAFELYENQKNMCERMAAQENIDINLRIFYAKAAQGYKIKQEKLTLAEARK